MEAVIVTSTLAMRWMMRQTHHQHDGQADLIESYARRMRSGLWLCDGKDPVKFDQRGRLYDGRCRVAAAIIAGLPVRLHVIGWVFGPFPHNEDEIA